MTKETKEVIRFGLGYDVHRLVQGRKLVLGGVRIPSNIGLLGHSDADVLLHAICDALLGAAALGDIGKHFPDINALYRNISSLKLLKQVGILIRENGFAINNIDSTVVLEKPKIAKYVDVMRQRIGKALKISPQFISIKATTHEGLGSFGRGEGCAAFAIASILQKEIK
ncbi:MAG: 2-C-methyl-D-erythritol 2,4-cyclodiphosphate synthase [Ignavibacteriales bacterium]|nr:2-C-methyl-D-erythritol 2,4-cyclodiphosphate synthase [Ignavibacteriales bacterium]